MSQIIIILYNTIYIFRCVNFLLVHSRKAFCIDKILCVVKKEQWLKNMFKNIFHSVVFNNATNVLSKMSFVQPLHFPRTCMQTNSKHYIKKYVLATTLDTLPV